MRRALTILLVTMAAVAAATAQAQTIDWKYAEAGWTTVDPDRGSSENGWFLGGAFDLGKVPIHLFGEFADYDSANVWQVGGGWHGLLGERADLFADGAFYDADVENGFRVRFGARWMVTKRFEVNGHLSWLDLDFSDNKSAAVGLVANLGARFGIGGTYEWGDNFNFGRVFARFNFGARK